MWQGIDCDNYVIEELTTVFVDQSGAIHCFNPECFLTIIPDSNAPGSLAISDIYKTRYHWGLVKNVLSDKVDAGVVDTQGITYLFSGDQYVRYSSDDYRKIDQDYPKSIAINLRQEASFKHLPDEFEEKIAQQSAKLAAVVINQRNVYLVIDTTLFVASTELAANYDLNKLACGEQPFLANGKIDAAIAFIDSSDNNNKKSYTYLFSGNRFIRYSGDEYEYIDSGYPKTIASGLSNVPVELVDGIDAALKDKDGNVHLIKDRQVWNKDKNEKKDITKTAWLQIDNQFANVTSINAAIMDPEGGLLVFKDNQYIRYGSPLQKYVDPGYPKSIKNNWGNLPNDFESGIDAAFEFEGHSYFVKGEKYVRFINNSHECPQMMGPYEFKLRWGNWADYLISDIKVITEFKQLNDTYASGDSTLTDILHPKPGYTKLPYFDLAELFDWDIDQLKWLKKHNGFLQKHNGLLQNHNQFEKRFNLELILRIFDFFQVAEKISTEPKTLYEEVLVKLFVTPDFTAAKEELTKLLTTTHCGAKGVELLHNEIRDKLNLLKRDALLPYAINQDQGVSNARELYQKLLIDVEMGSEVSISKIKEAIAAVQLFMHRYFINLEPAELKPDQVKRRQDLLKRWEWMKNYRVWEANRKVFLYPENYIRAELRDSKTPEFKALEQELLQGELNDVNVTQAFNRFIDQYIELSQLKVAGGYVYDNPENTDDKNMVLFGHTISEPRRYYYRNATFINGKSDSVNWQPWEEVNIQINSERVYPVYTLNRVYVFWAEIEQNSDIGQNTELNITSDNSDAKKSTTKVDSNATFESVLQIYYSYYDLNKTWVPAQKLNYSITSRLTIIEYFLDFSSSKRNSDLDLDSILINCRYTTDQGMLKAKIKDNKYVDVDDLIKLIKEAATDNKVYLTTTINDNKYIVNSGQSDSPTTVYLDHLRVKRFIAGDKLKEPQHQFEIVKPKPLGQNTDNEQIAIKATAKNIENHYFRAYGKKLFIFLGDYKREGVGLTDPVYTFKIKEGRIGEGYTIYNYYQNHTWVMSFNDHGELRLDPFVPNADDEAKRRQTFQIIAEKREWVSKLRFYPETRTVKNETSDQDIVDVNSSGKNLFEDLFPQEDTNKLEPPVILNSALEDKSLNWTCFHYKGGSFLAKPNYKVDKTIITGQISPGSSTFTMNAAFVDKNDKLYPFSKEGNCGTYDTNQLGENTPQDADGDGEKEFKTIEIENIESTQAKWGKVNNLIQDNNAIDAACVIDGKIYLFRGDQYVCYSNGISEFADEGYPDQHKDITGWDEEIDAAFQFQEKSYFIKGNQYTVSDDLNSKKPLSDLWKSVSRIDYAFTKNNHLYLISGNKYCRYSGTSLDNRDPDYTKFIVQGLEDDIPNQEDITAAFTSADNKTYFFKEHDYFIFPKEDVKKGLVAHYPFKDNAEDISGNAHHGTVNGATLTTDQFVTGGKAYKFDEGNYIEISDAPSLKLTNQSFTVSAWVFVNSFPDISNVGSPRPDESDLTILGNDWVEQAQKGEVLALLIRDKKPYMGFFLDDTKIDDTRYELNEKQWYCLTWRYDKKTLKQSIFVDGENKTTNNSNQNNPFKGTGKVAIGRWGASINYRYFNGMIDELKIYDRALTEDEIKQLAGKLATPTAINSKFGKVRNPIQTDGVVDAAFTHGEKTYLFSGNLYYRYDRSEFPDDWEDTVASGYPKLLKNNTDGLPKWNGVRAVFKKEDQVHLFSKSLIQYAIFDPTHDAPLEIENIRGNLVLRHGFDSLDAAFNHGSDIYLVYGDKYIKVNAEQIVTAKKTKYDIIRLSSMTGNKLSQKLFAHGIDGLFSLRNQEIDELPMFTRLDYDLNLKSLNSTDDLPKEGKNLVIVAKIGNFYHVRIFNYKEKQVVDKGNDEFSPDAMLVQKLDAAFSNQPIDNKTKDELIEKITSSLGYTPLDEISGDSIIKAKSDRVEQLPLHSHLEFRGANGLYYWELFFHAPLLIAQSLNTQQKFAEAKQWFEYIFDPTDAYEYWQFLPFLSVDIEALITLIKYYASQEYELKLISTDTKEFLPKEGKNLVIFAKIGDEYRVVIFNKEGNKIRDYKLTPDKMLLKQWEDASSRQGIGNQDKWEITIENQSKWDFLQKIASIKDKDDPKLIKKASDVIDLLQPYEEVFEGKRELSSTELTDKTESNANSDLDVLKKLPTQQAITNLQTTVDQLEKDNPNAKALAETLEIVKRLPIRYGFMVPDETSSQSQIQAYLNDPFDPHAIARLRRIAYRRTTVMGYIDNLIDWGDQLFRQYNRESINEARMHYILAYDLLGQKPENTGTRYMSDALPYKKRDENNQIIGIHDTGAEEDSSQYDFLFDVSGDNRDEKSLTFAANIHSSVTQPYFYIPENQNLIDYWDRIEDRLYKIRHSLNIMGIKQPLPLFQPPIDPMALVRAVAGGGAISGAVAGLSVPVPHYRFNFMLNKARELVGKLNQFGGDLLGAIEKKDSEALSLLQNRHEKEILEVTIRIKEAQKKDSLENLKSLEENLISAKNQVDEYTKLLHDGQIDHEIQQLELMKVASGLHYTAAVIKTAASVAALKPKFRAGPPFASSVDSPAFNEWLTNSGDTISSYAEGLSVTGEMAGMMAQYIRMKGDWELQKLMAESEIKQLSAQIEGAKYQIQVARLEIQSTEKEIKQNESMKQFMTSKFSNEQLYQWMTSKLSGLFFQTYKLAHDMAKSAEKAYQFERGLKESDVSFIGGMYWDSLRKGLLSGDSLGHDLDRMEKAYLDTNSRSLEIGKHISLAELDPMAFIQLKTKGTCEFNLSEAFFDYDFQGHYNRQVKTIAIVIDAGEGKTVNATLTQLRHKTVMEPDVKAVKYLLNPQGKEPMSIRSDWRTTQQIALGDIGEYDEPNGLFELRLDDERFLPFEGTGAVSTWRLELSGKRGSYHWNDLKNVTIKLKYTALNGGSAFASAVKGMLKPYPTAVYINMAETFPQEWQAFISGETEDLNIQVTREMLPNLSGSKITGLVPHYDMQGEGQVSLIMNEDDDLTLKHGKFNEGKGLMIRSSGATWNFKAKGNKKSLSNLGLVVMYKAVV